MTARRITCALVLLAWARPAGAQQKIILRQQFPPGRYVLDVKGKLKQSVKVNKARSRGVEISRRLLLDMRVLPADGQGVTRMELSFRRIVYKVVSRGRSMAYDSAEDPPQLGRLGQLLGPLAEAKVSVAIGADGSVAEVRGLDEVWDARSRKDPDVQTWLKQTKAEMGDAMIRELFEQVPAFLPDGAVARGQSWKTKTSFTMPYVGKRECDQRVTLKTVGAEEGRQVAHLDLAGKTTDAGVTDARADEMPLTLRKSRVAQRGQVSLEVKTHLPLSFSIDRDCVLEMTGKDPRKGAFTVVFSRSRSRIVTLRPDKNAGAKTGGN